MKAAAATRTTVAIHTQPHIKITQGGEERAFPLAEARCHATLELGSVPHWTRMHNIGNVTGGTGGGGDARGCNSNNDESIMRQEDSKGMSNKKERVNQSISVAELVLNQRRIGSRVI